MAKTLSGAELLSLLKRALYIERTFENEAQWEGYYEKEELRGLLIELIMDSGKHAVIVESLMSRVKADGVVDFTPPHGKLFNFRSKNDLEIMMELEKTEKLMFDMYSQILTFVKSSNIEGIIKKEDLPGFITDLESLVKWEKHHMELVSSHVGKVERIR